MEQIGPHEIALKFCGGRFAVADNEYLEYAEQCVALAANSSNPADKARLLQMAQAWRVLSEKRNTEPQKNGDG
jgi:hypothetical protein